MEVMVDMASNLMLVDEHLLWLAQREDKACSGIVGALERIGGAALSPHAQHISVVWYRAPHCSREWAGVVFWRAGPQCQLRSGVHLPGPPASKDSLHEAQGAQGSAEERGGGGDASGLVASTAVYRALCWTQGAGDLLDTGAGGELA